MLCGLSALKYQLQSHYQDRAHGDDEGGHDKGTAANQSDCAMAALLQATSQPPELNFRPQARVRAIVCCVLGPSPESDS